MQISIILVSFIEYDINSLACVLETLLVSINYRCIHQVFNLFAHSLDCSSQCCGGLVIDRLLVYTEIRYYDIISRSFVFSQAPVVYPFIILPSELNPTPIFIVIPALALSLHGKLVSLRTQCRTEATVSGGLRVLKSKKLLERLSLGLFVYWGNRLIYIQLEDQGTSKTHLVCIQRSE